MDTFFCGPENKKMYGRDDPESPIFKIIGKRARMNAVPLDGVIHKGACRKNQDSQSRTKKRQKNP